MQVVQYTKARFDQLRSAFQQSSNTEALTALTLAEQVLDEAVRACTPNPNDLLTLTEAAEWTGYSRGHLTALLRTQQLTNHGRRRQPRLRRAELPLKGLARAR